MIFLSDTMDEHGRISEGSLAHPLVFRVSLTESGNRVTVEKRIYLVANDKVPGPDIQTVIGYENVTLTVSGLRDGFDLKIAADDGGHAGEYGLKLDLGNLDVSGGEQVIPVWVMAGAADDESATDGHFTSARIDLGAKTLEP